MNILCILGNAGFLLVDNILSWSTICIAF